MSTLQSYGPTDEYYNAESACMRLIHMFNKLTECDPIRFTHPQNSDPLLGQTLLRIALAHHSIQSVEFIEHSLIYHDQQKNNSNISINFRRFYFSIVPQWIPEEKRHFYWFYCVRACAYCTRSASESDKLHKIILIRQNKKYHCSFLYGCPVQFLLARNLLMHFSIVSISKMSRYICVQKKTIWNCVCSPFCFLATLFHFICSSIWSFCPHISEKTFHSWVSCASAPPFSLPCLLNALPAIISTMATKKRNTEETRLGLHLSVSETNEDTWPMATARH